jgi:hypothetical protein
VEATCLHLHPRFDLPRISQLLKLLFAQSLMRSKDGFALDVLQLRYPFPYIVPIGIALLRLTDRIEDRVRRLPAIGIVRHVPIDEMGREVPVIFKHQSKVKQDRFSDVQTDLSPLR